MTTAPMLLLLRHAKSSWDDPGLADHDRILNKRGREAATRMGRYLAEEGLVPDLIACSTARRTEETLARLCRAMGETPETRMVAALYHAAPNTIRSVINAAPDAKRLMVIGHNPGLHDLALTLADPHHADQQALDGLRAKFPTAALAVFIRPHGPVAPDTPHSPMRLARFIAPRQLDMN